MYLIIWIVSTLVFCMFCTLSSDVRLPTVLISFTCTAVKVGVPKLGNCLEMYTCAQACIHFQSTRSGQACTHAVYKLGTGLGMCTFQGSFQAWALQLLQQCCGYEIQTIDPHHLHACMLTRHSFVSWVSMLFQLSSVTENGSGGAQRSSQFHLEWCIHVDYVGTLRWMLRALGHRLLHFHHM